MPRYPPVLVSSEARSLFGAVDTQCVDCWNVGNVAQKNLEATEPPSSKWLELCAADEQRMFVRPHSVVRKALLGKRGN